MNSILVTRKLPSSVLSKLETVGDVDLYTGDTAMPADELRSRVVGKHAVVSMFTEQIDKAVLDAGDRPARSSPTSRSATTTSMWRMRARAASS